MPESLTVLIPSAGTGTSGLFCLRRTTGARKIPRNPTLSQYSSLQRAKAASSDVFSSSRPRSEFLTHSRNDWISSAALTWLWWSFISATPTFPYTDPPDILNVLTMWWGCMSSSSLYVNALLCSYSSIKQLSSSPDLNAQEVNPVMKSTFPCSRQLVPKGHEIRFMCVGINALSTSTTFNIWGLALSDVIVVFMAHLSHVYYISHFK